MGYTYESDKTGSGVVAAFIIFVIMSIFLFNIWAAYGTERTETFKVVKTERVQDRESSRYMVFSESGVYQNTDSILRMKFNSSDLYSYILEEQTYTCKVIGFRIPILSKYPNLLSCEVKQSE